MAMIMVMTTIATALSALMLAVLLWIYVKNFRQIKSKFTAGLMVFAGLMLLQNIVSLYYYFTMMDLYVAQVSVQVLIYSLLQMVAYIVLLFITLD